MSPASTFTGFDRNAMGFFYELRAEMSRDWYQANKARYQTLWVTPTVALLSDVRTKIAAAYKPLQLGEPRVMRIHRDVRFAKDKTPYKTHIGAAVMVGAASVSEGGNTALYFHVGLDDEMLGAGIYMFDPGRLAKWRQAVVGKPGAELLALYAKLRKAGFTVGGTHDYKRVPQGFAADHPRGELLRQRGLTAMFPAIPAGMLHNAELVPWVTKHAKAVAPLVRWLSKHVG